MPHLVRAQGSYKRPIDVHIHHIQKHTHTHLHIKYLLACAHIPKCTGKHTDKPTHTTNTCIISDTDRLLEKRREKNSFWGISFPDDLHTGHSSKYLNKEIFFLNIYILIHTCDECYFTFWPFLMKIVPLQSLQMVLYIIKYLQV